MKAVPRDPVGAYQRFFSALLEDIEDAQWLRDRSTPRANAVIEIARQQRGQASLDGGL